jgi:ATP-dependent DNA ligase
MARRDAAGVQLLTRNGIDWSFRFPLIVQAVGALSADRRRGDLLR